MIFWKNSFFFDQIHDNISCNSRNQETQDMEESNRIILTYIATVFEIIQNKLQPAYREMQQILV